MAAYDYIDEAVAGLLYGLDNQIEGGWAAKEEIEFGRPVFGYAGDEKSLYNFYNDVGKIVWDADFITGNLIDITVNTVSVAQVPFNTDHDTTMDDIVSAVSALSGVECILDPDDVNNRTIYVRVKGVTAALTEDVTGGASQASGTITYTTGQTYVGVSVKTQNAPGVYEQYDAVNVLARGTVYADCSTAAKANQDALVGVDSKFANSGLSVNARFRSTISTAGLVIVESNGQTDLGVADLFAA